MFFTAARGISTTEFPAAPDDTGRVSFTIRRVAGGAFSPWVFDNDPVGAALTLRGPGGDFYLRPGAGTVVIVAGGFGLAPILALLEEIERTRDPRPATVLFGARQEKDLYALDRLRGLEVTRPNFRFVPVLSDDDYNNAWQGKHGLDTDFLGEEALGTVAAYLCGPPMVDAAQDALEAGGLAKEAIFADRFIV